MFLYWWYFTQRVFSEWTWSEIYCTMTLSRGKNSSTLILVTSISYFPFSRVWAFNTIVNYIFFLVNRTVSKKLIVAAGTVFVVISKRQLKLKFVLSTDCFICFLCVFLHKPSACQRSCVYTWFRTQQTCVYTT